MPDSNRDSHWCLLLLLFYWFLLLLSHSAAAALQRQSGAQTAKIHRNAGDRPHPTVGIQHQIHVPGISSSSLPVFCPTVCGHSDLSGPERLFLIWSVMFQDFVHHFHVLLPRGMSPTKSAIRDFFRKVHLPPAGYQVGSTMVCVCVCSPGLDQCWSLGLGVEKCSCLLKVFLREAERQRLQTLLHQEVLRRIVTLQRRFRAMLERKHFVNMRRSASTIQVGCFDWRTERLGLRRCYYGSCCSWWL